MNTATEMKNPNAANNKIQNFTNKKSRQYYGIFYLTIESYHFYQSEIIIISIPASTVYKKIHQNKSE